MGAYVWLRDPQYELALWSTSDSCGFPQRIQMLRLLSTGQMAFNSSSLANARRCQVSLISLLPSPTWARTFLPGRHPYCLSLSSSQFTISPLSTLWRPLPCLTIWPWVPQKQTLSWKFQCKQLMKKVLPLEACKGVGAAGQAMDKTNFVCHVRPSSAEGSFSYWIQAGELGFHSPVPKNHWRLAKVHPRVGWEI